MVAATGPARRSDQLALEAPPGCGRCAALAWPGTAPQWTSNTHQASRGCVAGRRSGSAKLSLGAAEGLVQSGGERARRIAGAEEMTFSVRRRQEESRGPAMPSASSLVQLAAPPHPELAVSVISLSTSRPGSSRRAPRADHRSATSRVSSPWFWYRSSSICHALFCRAAARTSSRPARGRGPTKAHDAGLDLHLARPDVLPRSDRKCVRDVFPGRSGTTYRGTR